MVAHSVGESDLMATLVNAGIRVAQCLGLHRIPDERAVVSSVEERMEVLWEREVGRRVWWKLVELDYHSMPYTGTLTINPKSSSTRMPLNSDDDRLVDRDASVLTISTCAVIMSKIARLMPDILEGRYATDRDETAKYQQVILADRRMRELVATLPAVTLRKQGASQEPQCSWIATARRTLAISAADKIIMIHRSFLLKSLQSPLYLFTRNTCVSAAMTILREHGELSVSGSGCFSIWVHSAFCVTATVVLCLNILHADKQIPPSLRSIEQQLDLVMSARARLESQRCDTMARRGVHLIDAMLEERDRLHFLSNSAGLSGQGEMSFDLIARKFFELQDSNSDRSVESSDSVVDTEGLSMAEWPQEFDAWFRSTFKC
ncbi:hypothetical protein KC343_g1876 [Hortaea werneckii]|nr:hypothetical protein KC352_g8266 [Hortaea werneckii]KAI7571609.1 hypothetical protein KC317_g1488 [Hortaea werneckii]KAI7628428.1 hypothetical protein KC346_g182 [Hortaea werneckii]KAI7635368.1 hypothetical protein KC343_g1876 [Hortaea werneckii]KAI7683870.1 hypothetical protein KC319_g229 [Hortaea werneckii]